MVQRKSFISRVGEKDWDLQHTWVQALQEGHTSRGAGTCADWQQTSTRSRGRGGPPSPSLPAVPVGAARFHALRKASKGCSIKLVRVVHCPCPQGETGKHRKCSGLEERHQGRQPRCSLTAWALRWAQRHQGWQPRRSLLLTLLTRSPSMLSFRFCPVSPHGSL